MSSLDGLRVNHAGLDEAAADLKATVDKIDKRMDQLESELNKLKGGGWEGNAQQTYLQAKAQWDWAIQEMKDLLDKTSQTVYQSNADYRAADKRGADAFQIKV